MPRCQRCNKFIFIANDGYCTGCVEKNEQEKKWAEHLQRENKYKEIVEAFRLLKASTTSTDFEETKAKVDQLLKSRDIEGCIEFLKSDSQRERGFYTHKVMGPFSAITADDFRVVARSHFNYLVENKARVLRENTEESMPITVVGVTFKNGRKSRQTILRKLKFGDPPFDSYNVDMSLRKYEFEGEPAFGVYALEEQVGNVPKYDVPKVLEKWEKYIGVSEFHVYGGGNKHSGEPLSYGLEIRVRFKK